MPDTGWMLLTLLLALVALAEHEKRRRADRRTPPRPSKARVNRAAALEMVRLEGLAEELREAAGADQRAVAPSPAWAHCELDCSGNGFCIPCLGCVKDAIERGELEVGGEAARATV